MKLPVNGKLFQRDESPLADSWGVVRYLLLPAFVLSLSGVSPVRTANAQLAALGSPGQGVMPYAQLGSRPGTGGQSGAAKAHPAVARIIVPEGDGTSYGSGTLIDVRDQYGLVVTNWHVVRDATDRIEVVFPDGFRSFGQALKVDKDWDLAALVIWRPNVTPVPLAASAPQPGDALTIAGYGKGTYRALTGRCTQYLSPTVQLPREMVEVSVAARQGDSGGPIFNAQGELAGVLWGAGSATTLGSYAGRVSGFLASVAPHLDSQNETQIAARLRDAPPLRTPLAGQMLGMTTRPSNPKQAEAQVPAYDSSGSGLVNVEPATRDSKEAEAAKAVSAYAASIAAAQALEDAAREAALLEEEARHAAFNDRAALEEPTYRKEFANNDWQATGIAPLAATTAGVANEGETANEVVEIPLTWHDIAGESYFDQAKTVFAVLGILAVLHFFLRRSGS